DHRLSLTRRAAVTSRVLLKRCLAQVVMEVLDYDQYARKIARSVYQRAMSHKKS
ncbi:Hypothetical predicted protein, partial [Olea europaea subsp. europaea]